jgi:hypothetical protein
VSLIMPPIRYGGIVYAGMDAASQRRLNTAFKLCLRYIHSLWRLDHVSHFDISVMGTSLADYARIQLLLFLHKVLHVRMYLFSLFSPLMYLVAGRGMRCFTTDISQILPERAYFICFRCGIDASN